MSSIADLLRAGADLPSDEARLEAELLLCHCINESRTYLYTWPEREVSPDLETRYHELLDRRRGGQPVAYLIGEREFWSLSLSVNEHTLIPRPDTEVLVEWALALDLPQDAQVIDLGTGSGAIALALASERHDWRVSATDISAGALAVASANAQRLGLGAVRCLQSDWWQGLEARSLDLVVSNPPYIEERDSHLLQGDLRFEPTAALASGVDGLDAIRSILAGLGARLNPGGWILLEHGFAQAERVCELLREAGLERVESRQDLSGLDRVSGGQMP